MLTSGLGIKGLPVGGWGIMVDEEEAMGPSWEISPSFLKGACNLWRCSGLIAVLPLLLLSERNRGWGKRTVPGTGNTALW